MMAASDLYDECGVPKTTKHVLLHCHKFETLRREVVKEIPIECLNVDNLHGKNSRYCYEMNIKMQRSLQVVILASQGRFT